LIKNAVIERTKADSNFVFSHITYTFRRSAIPLSQNDR